MRDRPRATAAKPARCPASTVGPDGAVVKPWRACLRPTAVRVRAEQVSENAHDCAQVHRIELGSPSDEGGVGKQCVARYKAKKILCAHGPWAMLDCWVELLQ